MRLCRVLTQNKLELLVNESRYVMPCIDKFVWRFRLKGLLKGLNASGSAL